MKILLLCLSVAFASDSGNSSNLKADAKIDGNTLMDLYYLYEQRLNVL